MLCIKDSYLGYIFCTRADVELIRPQSLLIILLTSYKERL